MNGGAYVVVQQNPPGDAIGHIVVLVGYDPVRGFKVKSSDENDGRVEWIPENRITWFQSCVTEEEYEAATYDYCAPNGIPARNQNGRFCNREKVISTLNNAYQAATNEQLGTNFNQRTGILLSDFGFVLKFKKICQCQGDTCEHTFEEDKYGKFVVKFE